jgi:hypothetical protein
LHAEPGGEAEAEVEGEEAADPGAAGEGADAAVAEHEVEALDRLKQGRVELEAAGVAFAE